MSAQPEIEISDENIDIDSLNMVSLDDGNITSLDDGNITSLDETSLFSEEEDTHKGSDVGSDIGSDIGSDAGSDSIKLNEFKEDINELNQEDHEDQDEEDNDENLKKIESSFNNSILLDLHPELKQQNYNEILAMCKIIRNKKNEIIDPLHKTIPWLTKFEVARILGLRSKQINNGADTFVDVPPEIISGYTIAEMELEQKKVPFIIRRPLPSGGSEYWRVSDLDIIDI